MERVDFSRYGKVFQDKLVYLILTERSFAEQIGEVLDINFLEFKYLQSIARNVYDYKDKYGSHPSLKMIASIIQTSAEDDVVKEQSREYLRDSLQDSSIIQDSDYVK